MGFSIRLWLPVVWLVLLSISTGDLFGDNFSDRLEWGKHKVGFKSEIVLDHSRAYAARFDEAVEYGVNLKRPRPVVINLWYPVDEIESGQRPMPYRRYLDLQSDQADVQEWANSLSKYAADVITGEFFDKRVMELDEAETGLWNRFLEQPTHAYADAKPSAGPFPVVVYHSGAGSSYEDNSVFCEFLASSGFVVMGSAYPAANGKSLGVDGKGGSVRDMEFLSDYASRLDFTDWSQICFAGHSFGAQASLRASTRPDCPASVLMLLDTTVDYYSLAIPTFDYLTKEVLANVEYIDQPMFVATGKGALFQMCDRLVKSERTYLTFPKLNHNEFISQGIFRLQVLEWLPAEQIDEDGKRELSDAENVRALYIDLCHLCRDYLRVQLNVSETAFLERAKGFTEHHDRQAIAIDYVEAGMSKPEPYSTDRGIPPTPRQLMPLLNDKGVVALCETLSEFHESHPDSPIFESNMLVCSLLYDLAVANRVDDASYLHRHTKQLGSDGVGTIRFLAFMCELQKKSELERHFLELALSIDPSDEKTIQKIEALNARMKTTDEQSPKDLPSPR